MDRRGLPGGVFPKVGVPERDLGELGLGLFDREPRLLTRSSETRGFTISIAPYALRIDAISELSATVKGVLPR